MHLELSTTALLSLLLAVPSAAQRAETPDTLEAPLVRLADAGPDAYALLSWDADVHAALGEVHERRGVGRLTDLPLPGGDRVDLVLRPFEVWEPGGTAIVVDADGSTRRVAPSVRLFALHAPGRASRGFLGVSATRVYGTLALGDDDYVLSTGAQSGGPLAITHTSWFARTAAAASGTPGADWCDSRARPTPALATVSATPAPSRRGVASPVIRETTIFVDCDERIRARFSSDQEMVDYATLLVGVTSEVYRRDVGVRVLLPSGYVRVWNGPGAWSGYPGGYHAWFNSPSNPLNGIERSLVHKLSSYGRNSSAQGPNLCRDKTAFADSGVKGAFPHPLEHSSADNWDLYVFGHENGHIHGSDHTYTYAPPIQCDDGSGPDEGTLMSYCAWPAGTIGFGQPAVEKIGIRFHERVQRVIRALVASRSCPDVVPYQPGDYDANGFVDPSDLAEFDAYLTQGFVSLGAAEAFDVNADGSVDALDRALMVAAQVAPASTTLFNGSGANPLGFGAVTQPVLGSTWTTLVANPTGGPASTRIVGADDRLGAPLATRFGEVLVAAAGVGGATVFSSTVLSNGASALHAVPLPLEPALVGRRLETQAVVVGAGVAVLLNGLTVVPSTY